MAEGAFQGLFGSNLEIDSQVRMGSETVDIFNPVSCDPTRNITSEGSVDVAISQNNGPTSERRYDIPFIAFGEIGSMQDAQKHRVERALFLTILQSAFDEFRRLELSEDDFMTLGLQPELEQVQLCTL